MKLTSKPGLGLPLALGLSLISSYSVQLPVSSAEQNTPNTMAGHPSNAPIAVKRANNRVAIRNICLNFNKQLVIEFENQDRSALPEPQIKDYPGEKHDIVLEFPHTGFVVNKLPKARMVLDSIAKTYPDLNSIAYATVANGSNARIRLGVSANVPAHPRLVKIGRDVMVINLDLPDSSKNNIALSKNVLESKNQTNVKQNSSVDIVNNSFERSEKNLSHSAASSTEKRLTASKEKPNKLSAISKGSAFTRFINKSDKKENVINSNLNQNQVATETKADKLPNNKKKAEPAVLSQTEKMHKGFLFGKKKEAEIKTADKQIAISKEEGEHKGFLFGKKKEAEIKTADKQIAISKEEGEHKGFLFGKKKEAEVKTADKQIAISKEEGEHKGFLFGKKKEAEVKTADKQIATSKEEGEHKGFLFGKKKEAEVKTADKQIATSKEEGEHKGFLFGKKKEAEVKTADKQIAISKEEGEHKGFLFGKKKEAEVKTADKQIAISKEEGEHKGKKKEAVLMEAKASEPKKNTGLVRKLFLSKKNKPVSAEQTSMVAAKPSLPFELREADLLVGNVPDTRKEPEKQNALEQQESMQSVGKLFLGDKTKGSHSNTEVVAEAGSTTLPFDLREADLASDKASILKTKSETNGKAIVAKGVLGGKLGQPDEKNTGKAKAVAKSKAEKADASKSVKVLVEKNKEKKKEKEIVQAPKKLEKVQIAKVKPATKELPTTVAIGKPSSQRAQEIKTAFVSKTDSMLRDVDPVIEQGATFSTLTEERKAVDEPVITPISVEQALKEKANALSTVRHSSTEEQHSPIAVESGGDQSIASDLKTGFSQSAPNVLNDINKTDKVEPVSREIASDKKENDKIVDTVVDPLDKSTGAVINNASAKAQVERQSQPSNAVKLRVQKAHVGGKDYFPPKFSDAAIDHYNAAVKAHLSGKLPEAIKEYNAAIQSDQKMGEAYSNLGLIYNQMHKYDQAMVEFHKALAINPKDAITYNGIGAAMRAKHNMLAATKNWQNAVNIDPKLASAHYNLGTAYEINKDLEKALGQYREAVKHDGKLGEAYYRMGLVLQKLNNKNLAMQEYKQAIKISQRATYASDAKRRVTLLSAGKNHSM